MRARCIVRYREGAVTRIPAWQFIRANRADAEACVVVDGEPAARAAGHLVVAGSMVMATTSDANSQGHWLSPFWMNEKSGSGQDYTRERFCFASALHSRGTIASAWERSRSIRTCLAFRPSRERSTCSSASRSQRRATTGWRPWREATSSIDWPLSMSTAAPNTRSSLRAGSSALRWVLSPIRRRPVFLLVFTAAAGWASRRRAAAGSTPRAAAASWPRPGSRSPARTARCRA